MKYRIFDMILNLGNLHTDYLELTFNLQDLHSRSDFAQAFKYFIIPLQISVRAANLPAI